MKSKKSVSMKAVVVLMALVLLIGCGVGGTLAWLMDQTKTVTNTFTVGDINIDLKETVGEDSKSAADNAVENNNFKILPGTSQAKDPTVIVEAGSEACYVFVQVQEINNIARAADDSATAPVSELKYVTWEIDDANWKQLGNVKNGVYTYYLSQSALTAEDAEKKEYAVLNGDTSNSSGVVTYDQQLTKDMIEKIYDKDGKIDPDKQPQLIFKAFAVQMEAGSEGNDDAAKAAKAWEQVPETERLTSNNS